MSGGEDTTLRLFSIETLHQLKTAFVIRSHVSSIKAISYLLVDDAMLVVSVGGRAQMKIFRIRTTPTSKFYRIFIFSVVQKIFSAAWKSIESSICL